MVISVFDDPSYYWVKSNKITKIQVEVFRDEFKTLNVNGTILINIDLNEVRLEYRQDDRLLEKGYLKFLKEVPTK